MLNGMVWIFQGHGGWLRLPAELALGLLILALVLVKPEQKASNSEERL
jgi:hypothetical protein